MDKNKDCPKIIGHIYEGFYKPEKLFPSVHMQKNTEPVIHSADSVFLQSRFRFLPIFPYHHRL